MVKITNILYNKQREDSLLEFTIDNVNHIILNTMRRTIMCYIPIYAFTEFKITKNNTIFHNNNIKLHIENIPVWGVKNKLVYYTKKDTEIKDEINIDEEFDYKEDQTLVADSLEQLVMYVHYINKTNDIVSVGTDNADFFYKQTKIENPYTENIQLIKLQPKQEIKMSVITSVGIEKYGAKFSPINVCYYYDLPDNKYLFGLESRGQITEPRICIVAILNIIKKLNIIINQVTDEVATEGTIQLDNEDSTMGELLVYGYQENDNVLFANYKITHPQENRIIITYKLKKYSIAKITNIICTKLINTYEEIKTLIEKI